MEEPVGWSNASLPWWWDGMGFVLWRPAFLLGRFYCPLRILVLPLLLLWLAFVRLVLLLLVLLHTFLSFVSLHCGSVCSAACIFPLRFLFFFIQTCRMLDRVYILYGIGMHDIQYYYLCATRSKMYNLLPSSTNQHTKIILL